MVVENDPGFKGELRVAFQLVEIENLHVMQKIKEALNHLKEISASNHPDVAYWSYKLHDSEPSIAIEGAQKYIDVCKTVTPAQRRQFKLEPRLCKKTEEVEEYLAHNEEKK